MNVQLHRLIVSSTSCVWTLSSITVTSPQLSSPWPQEQPIDVETLIRKVQTIRLRHAQLLVLIVIQSILVKLPIPSERHILTLMLWTSGVRWSRGLFVQEEESPWCCICSWSWTRCQWARVKSQEAWKTVYISYMSIWRNLNVVYSDSNSKYRYI